MLDEILKKVRGEFNDVKLINAQSTMMFGESEIWFVIFSHGYSSASPELSGIRTYRWVVCDSGKLFSMSGGILEYAEGYSEV